MISSSSNSIFSIGIWIGFFGVSFFISISLEGSSSPLRRSPEKNLRKTDQPHETLSEFVNRPLDLRILLTDRPYREEQPPLRQQFQKVFSFGLFESPRSSSIRSQ